MKKIIKAFDQCVESIKCVEDQTGGTYKITYYENKLKDIYNNINILSIL